MIQKISKIQTLPLEKNPEVLFNSLVKLPGIAFDDEKMSEVINTYLNSNIILEVTKNTKDLDFKVNAVVIGKPLYNYANSVAKSRTVLDKSCYSIKDLVCTLAKTLSEEYLKDSVVILSIYTLAGYENATPFSLKASHSPYVIESELHKKFIGQASMYAPTVDTPTTTSESETNLIISFSGSSKLDFGLVYNANLKTPSVAKKYNDHHGIAKWMISSPLIRQSVFYENDVQNTGRMIEDFIKPKFLNNDFEFVAIVQDDYENPYFSKGCEELKEGVWITNPTAFKLLKDPKLFSKKEIGAISFKEIVDSEIRKIGKPVVAKAEIAVTVEASSQNAIVRSINPEPTATDISLLKNRHLLKISPPIVSIVAGVFVKEFVTSSNKVIHAGATVTFSRSSKYSLDPKDPYMCNIRYNGGKSELIEIMSRDQICENMIVMGKKGFNEFFEGYQKMKKDFYLEPLGTPLMDDLIAVKELLTSATAKLNIDKLFNSNYVIECYKVNGFKKYHYSLRALTLLLIEHVYYQRADYSKFNIIGNWAATVYCSKLNEVFVKEVVQGKMLEPFKIKHGALLEDGYPAYD